MKKLIALATIMAVMVLVAALAQAQSPANDLKPTFISPTPGLYVNGWPAFTVSYPKEWVEMPAVLPEVIFAAGAARPDLPPVLQIRVFAGLFPLEDWAKAFMHLGVPLFTDVKVLSDRPSKLKDGTPAREVEIEWVYQGAKRNDLLLAAKKEMTWVAIIVDADEGKLGEDVKRVAYSLTFQPDREKPVKVPPDVQAFLDMYCADWGNHDVRAVMEHFSDRFRDSGASKAYYEKWFRDPASPPQTGGTISASTVTVFEAHGNRAYIDGFWLFKAKADSDAVKVVMLWQQIINEHGQWRWFGNQK
ncbi:MAG: hypothetical protein ABSH25_16940 [Syntrophorhabdales bacterium]|jgi:hypothetical protein